MKWSGTVDICRGDAPEAHIETVFLSKPATKKTDTFLNIVNAPKAMKIV